MKAVDMSIESNKDINDIDFKDLSSESFKLYQQNMDKKVYEG